MNTVIDLGNNMDSSDDGVQLHGEMDADSSDAQVDVHWDMDTDSSDDEVQALEQLNSEIPECEGIPRREWNTKCVTLYNNNGLLVGESVVHSVSLYLVLDSTGPLGDTHVGVHISKILSEVDIPAGRFCNLVSWSIKLVYCRGASLHDHEARDKFKKLQEILVNPQSVTSSRPYTSTVRNPPRLTSVNVKSLLTQASINAVSSQICCARNCVQPFSREKIRAFRERMYHNSTFKHKQFMKADVHRQKHRDPRGRRIVTIDGTNVCMSTWMYIADVSPVSFYRSLKQVRNNQEARDHGNMGLKKSRKHTEEAAATLKCILQKEADHMPHRSRTLKSGDKVVSMILLANFQWKRQMSKINEVNAAFGLKDVSLSNLSKIRSKKFPEYDVKKPVDNFARCARCDELRELMKSALVRSQTAMTWSRRLERHHAIARAHRELYYANWYWLQTSPHECLTIMHDKMDHAKTASPVFSHKSKEIDGLMKLPVSVTGMIAHGHSDARYAHYGLDLFKHDSNYTIGSMAKLLRDLEQPSKSSSRELFVNAESTNLFEKVLKGKEMCEASLPPPPIHLIPATPLPPILIVQMDNATGDNKNKYVFCFWSLLVAKKIFCEVYVNFMIIGHTHDDIDALFGRWSMQLKKENFSTIPTLMKSFMDVESMPPIPHLIEEVPDFKGFIKGLFNDDSKALIGHTKPQQVKFYLDSDGFRVMMYKLKCTDINWSGESGRAIKLWKEDDEGQSLWPRGVPLLVEQNAMKSVEDIVKGISGFEKYWDNLCNVDVTGEYRRRYEHLVHYWRDVRVAIQEPLPVATVLKDGFWPTTRLQTNRVDQIREDGKDREEFAEDDAYVGPLDGRPQSSFRMGRDVFEGYFVVIRPADGDSRPVWIARALSNPNCNPEKPNCILIQYFRPTSRNQDVQGSYIGWDNVAGLRWKVDEAKPPLWENKNALMTAWKSQIRKNTMQCLIKIPVAQIEVINRSLASYT